MKTDKITRVVRILTALQTGKHYKAEDLARIFGTSRRTIFRDLKQLEAIGVPYRYDPATNGYRIDPEFFLPPIDFNLQEALALLILAHKTANQVQLPYKNSALLAALKIENNLPRNLRRYCNSVLSKLSTKSQAQAPNRMLDNTFAHLQRAVCEKIKVWMKYGSFYEGKTVETTFHPYHIHYNQRAWYIIGYSSLHQSIRTFKMNRIQQLELMNKKFLDGDDFDLYEHLGRAWSMIPEGKLYHIKLWFSPKVAGNVAEVQWHSTQHCNRHNDGSATLEFRVDGLNEISWWIMGYGDQVEVLAPKILRQMIADRARQTARLNS